MEVNDQLVKLLVNILVDLSPDRIESLANYNLPNFVDYFFAVLEKFFNGREGKGVYRALQIIEDLLEKFRCERDVSEVKRTILDHHCEILEKLCDNEDIYFADGRRKARNIVKEHFERELRG